jgi:hypothetical protein
MDVRVTQTGCRQCNKVTGKQWSPPQVQNSKEHGAIIGYILVTFYVKYLLVFFVKRRNISGQILEFNVFQLPFQSSEHG